MLQTETLFNKLQYELIDLVVPTWQVDFVANENVADRDEQETKAVHQQDRAWENPLWVISPH